jgi:D-alanyl-D-alanine carboxypeptidase-like protein
MAYVWRGTKDGLDPKFVADLEALLDKLPETWYILQGYRSIEESNALYAAYMAGKGPRAAPGGKSAHNFGLAVDVVLDADSEKPGLQPSWDNHMPAWLALKDRVEAHPRLHSGAAFNDWPHIERRDWQEHKGWNR